MPFPLVDYSHQVEEGVLACSRVRDLIRPCEILQPVAPYALHVDDVTITGEYAVLRSRHRKIKTFIPYFGYERVTPRRVIPDIVVFARCMDAFDRLPMCVWETNHISIMHYLVNQNNMEAPWHPDPKRAGEMLRGVLGAITRPYPRAGEHCQTCPTRDCRAAIYPFVAFQPFRPGQLIPRTALFSREFPVQPPLRDGHVSEHDDSHSRRQEERLP